MSLMIIPRGTQLMCPKPLPRRVMVSLPGLLEPAIRSRLTELSYSSFNAYALELIRFDLRSRREHFVTQPFAMDSVEVQHRIDTMIVQHYTPGLPEPRGALVKLVRSRQLNGGFTEAECLPVSAFRERVNFPEAIRPLVQVRFQELKYPSLSAYVAGLIRYDLMLAGPHKHAKAAQLDPAVAATMNEETVKKFLARERRRLLLEFLIEQSEGRELPEAELAERMQEIAQRIRRRGLRG